MAMVAAGLGITTAPLSHGREGVVPIRVEGYDFSRKLGFRADPAWMGEARGAILSRVAERFAKEVR